MLSTSVSIADSMLGIVHEFWPSDLEELASWLHAEV